jgi:hypothetical protein
MAAPFPRMLQCRLGEMSGYSANVNCGKSVSGKSGDMSESPESSSFRVE